MPEKRDLLYKQRDKLKALKEKAEGDVQDLISLIYDGENLHSELHKQLDKTRHIRNNYFETEDAIEVLVWRDRCITRLYAHYKATPERSAYLEAYIACTEETQGYAAWKAFASAQFVDEDFEVYYLENK